MIVMSFDLSGSCIGVVCVEIKDMDIGQISSCPIIPPKFDPTELGFLKNKKKIKTPNGKEINSYVKPNETEVTTQTKKKRDVEVRNAKDLFLMAKISESISKLIDNIKPDLILVEKNAIFNGVLTSVLLGKVMGVLLGLAGRLNIPVKEFTVLTVRKKHNVSNLIKEYAKRYHEFELKRIPDISKRVLREVMENKYNIKFLTDDESDACVVFDHWYEEVYKKKY